jgi:hypothetical protein
MKLFTKNTSATTVVMIMKTMRIIAIESTLPIAPVSGLINTIRTRSVNNTAICAMALFSFLTPLLQKSNTNPIIPGISAVTDGVSEEK